MTFVTCAMKNFPLCKVLDSNFSSQNIISLLPYNLTTFKADIQATHDKAYCIETSLIPTCPICTYPIKEDKYISKSVIETGLYQPTLTSILKLLLSLTQNGVFLDLGANFGYFSIWSACLGFKVVAFEAVTSNVLRIYEAASMSNLKQFDTYKFAVSGTNSKTSYVFEGRFIYWSRQVSNKFSACLHEVHVQSIFIHFFTFIV